MRVDMRIFLENVQEEGTMSFLLSNLKKEGLDELFLMLEYCSEEVRNRWHNHYAKLLNKSFKK